MGQNPLPNPCLDDNRVNDLAGVTFDSAPVTKAVRFQGPINARLYVSSIGGNGMLSVAVEDVAPDGTVKRLTGGWQVISDRALDTQESRYLDGKLIQPFHPFTKAAEKPLAGGRGRARRRRGLPDRRLDRAGSQAADRRTGLRHTAPDADAAPAARLADRDHHPQLGEVPVGADDPGRALSRPGFPGLKRQNCRFTQGATLCEEAPVSPGLTWETARPASPSSPRPRASSP